MKGQINLSIFGSGLQRRLRNTATDAEQALWRRLRGGQMDGCKFRRQHPFADYILDFVCVERHLIVELDGGQHAEQATADTVRTLFLEGAGFRVLRFRNHEVFANLDAVCEVIWRALQASKLPHPHPNPPLEGEGVEAVQLDVDGRYEPGLPLSPYRDGFLPPLQGEGRGGDGVPSYPQQTPHLPSEGSQHRGPNSDGAPSTSTDDEGER